MAKRLKSAEGSSSEMQRRIDELTVQFNSASGDNQRLQAEMARLRTAMQELQDKNDALARENKSLSGALRSFHTGCISRFVTVNFTFCLAATLLSLIHI